MPTARTLRQLAATYHVPREQDETEAAYRDRLANHVRQSDPIEAAEILIGKPWDQWTEPDKVLVANW
jgi:hypothetical protein